jgi:hypothetical protein
VRNNCIERIRLVQLLEKEAHTKFEKVTVDRFRGLSCKGVDCLRADLNKLREEVSLLEGGSSMRVTSIAQEASQQIDRLQEQLDNEFSPSLEIMDESQSLIHSKSKLLQKTIQLFY